MKAFKIKRRSYRMPTYIQDAPITNFKKPKFPLKLLFFINKPGIFELPENFKIDEIKRS
jgi:hypothetical protein